MATLYVAEALRADAATRSLGQVAVTPFVTEQTVAIGAGSLQSAAFGPATTLVRVHCDVVCSIAIGPDPTATTTKARMAANQTEYFAVLPGQKIAVIANA